MSKTAVDWNAIHERMRLLEDRLEAGTVVTGEEKRRILLERASKLAAAGNSAASSSTATDAIVFRRNAVRYAVELDRLREIAVAGDITPLPGTPAFCLGIVNLRGEILPLFDLSSFFSTRSASESGSTAPGRILVVETAENCAGIAADEVEGAIALAESDLDAPLATFEPRRAELIRGITRDHALLVDASKLLDSEHLVVDAGID